MQKMRPVRCMIAGLVATASLFLEASPVVAARPSAPRVDVEIDTVVRGSGISPESLLQSARSALESHGKFVVVATARERDYLRAVRHPALAARSDEAYACAAGQAVTTNSLVKVTISGKRGPKQLHLRLLSAEKGCSLSSGSSTWNADNPQRSLAEAITPLLANLSLRLQRSRPGAHPETPAATSAKGDCVTDPNLPPGRVTVTTQPFSTISWNGRELGQTPLARATLPAGCVILVAKNATLGLERQVRIKVSSGRDNLYKFALE